jgi:hypothetical protein
MLVLLGNTSEAQGWDLPVVVVLSSLVVVLDSELSVLLDSVLDSVVLERVVTELLVVATAVPSNSNWAL